MSFFRHAFKDNQLFVNSVSVVKNRPMFSAMAAPKENRRFRKFRMVLGSKLTHYPLEGRFSREAGILYS